MYFHKVFCTSCTRSYAAKKTVLGMVCTFGTLQKEFVTIFPMAHNSSARNVQTRVGACNGHLKFTHTREKFMSKLRSSLVSLSVVLSACAGVPATDQGPQSAMERFRTAFNKQDAAGVASVFREDGKLLPPAKPMIAGNDNIRAYWQAAFNAGVSHIDKTPIDFIVSGDLAVETGSYVVTFKDQLVKGKETLVWRRGTNSEWSIASDIWNNDK